MNEYISREAMLKNLTSDLEHHSHEGDSLTALIVRRFIKYVEDFPAADVQPVKRGRWECEFYNDVFDVYQADCSVCKRESTDKYDKVSESYEYCPHCGAKMIEGGNENDTL